MISDKQNSLGMLFSNLRDAGKKYSTAVERLSSGVRINRPEDDPGGKLLADKLDSTSKITARGVSNLNDGISLVNTASSAIEALQAVVTQLQEYTETGENVSLTPAQRDALQDEVGALQTEFNRIVDTTTYNGRSVLTGLNTATSVQGASGSAGIVRMQFGEAQLAGGLQGYGGTGTTRVSTDSSGNQVAGGLATAISADGRYVAFDSTATNLVAGDTNGQRDSFIKDTVTGITTRISTNSVGSQGTGGRSYATAISSDGRYVAFHSTANNLVAGDTNGQRDSFIKDTVTGITTRISTDSAGNQANGGGSYVTAISADGRYVAFRSEASNLVAGDTNTQIDSFIKDTVTGVTTRISTDSAGNQAMGGYSQVTAISADGRYVAFWSEASNLVAGDTNTQLDSFIKDTVTGVTTRISTDSAGNQATGGSSVVSAISSDGRYVVFFSDATNLVAGDTNTATDAFLKDTVSGVTTRISTDSSGNQTTGGYSNARAISADGRYVTFDSTATNLVAGDTNGQRDSFIKDTITGVTTRISTDSAGNQATGGSSVVTAMSADGRYLAFNSSATNLIAGDTNGQSDAFIRDVTKTGVQQLSGITVGSAMSSSLSANILSRYETNLSTYSDQIAAYGTSLESSALTLNTLSTKLSTAANKITSVDRAAEEAALIASQIRIDRTTSLMAQAVKLLPDIAKQLLQ